MTPTSDVSSASSVKILLGKRPPVLEATQTMAGMEDTAMPITVVAADDVPTGVLTYSAGAAFNGVVTGGVGGKFIYTPNKDFAGFDSFVVAVTDSDELTSTQKITVNVANVNDTPTVAATQVVPGKEDTAITFTVKASDADAGDVLSYAAAGAKNGIVTGGIDGKFNYTPNKDYFGSDIVKVTVTDLAGATATTVVTFNITPVNDAPVFAPTSPGLLRPGATWDFWARAFDVDNASEELTYLIERRPASGELTMIEPGHFLYRPSPSFVGQDSCILTVRDPAGAIATQTITFIVDPLATGAIEPVMLVGTNPMTGVPPGG